MNKPANVGAPRPMNTLLSNGPASRSRFGGVSSSQTLSNSPTTNEYRPSESSLLRDSRRVPIANPGIHDGALTPRKRSIGNASQAESQFSISPSLSSTSILGETISSKSRRKRKRPRKNTRSPGITGHGHIRARDQWAVPTNKENEDDYQGDNDESEDELNLLPTVLDLPKRRGPERPIEEYGNRFTKKRTLQLAEPIEQFKKVLKGVESRTLYRKDSSPDPLSLPNDVEETTRRPVKRTKTSPSGSSKGATIPLGEAKRAIVTKMPSGVDPIEYGTHERMKEAQQIIGHGLLIRRGASGQYCYRADNKANPECWLSIREISHTLVPVDRDNNILERYRYLTLNFEVVDRILYPDTHADCLIVAIHFKRILASVGAGPLLAVEFAEREGLCGFLRWATEVCNRSRQIRILALEKKKLESALEELESRATCHQILRDSDYENGIAGEDIRVMAHNHNKRTSETGARPNWPSEARPATKIKDAMKPTISPGGGQAISRLSRNNQASAQTRLQTTRSTFAYHMSESSESEPEGWTTLNPGWEKNWRNSLVFPSKGKNRAIVDKDDIQRLDEGQFLNDNIIIFYLRYLQKKVEDEHPELAKRVYFHNTFFYDKLKPTKPGKGINYDSVKAWTSKVDLFSKDYIIVPINEYTHWYVAIICNAPKLVPSSADRSKGVDDIENQTSTTPKTATLSQVSRQASPQDKACPDGSNTADTASIAQDDVVEHLRCRRGGSIELGSTPPKHDHTVHLIKDSDQPEIETERMAPSLSPQSRKKAGKGQSAAPKKYDPNQPRIITLDSLGATHSPTCGYLKQYLVAELRDKKGIEASTTAIMGVTARGIPEQSNHCDCGLYLLGYIQEFLNKPDVFIQSLVHRDGNILWRLEPSDLRASIRDRIFQLQKQQQEDENLAQEQKRKDKVQKMQATSELSVGPAVPSHSPSHHTSKTESASNPPREATRVENSMSTQLASLRPSPAISNTRVGEDAVVLVSKHTKSSKEDANPPVAMEQFSKPATSPGDLTRWAQVKKDASTDRTVFHPSSAVPSHQTMEASHLEAHHSMPGAFPRSPREVDIARLRSTSPETEGNSFGYQKGMVPPLSSTTSSSKGSRGRSPSDPVVVEDSGSTRHRPIVVEIPSKPSSNSHSQTEHQAVNAGDHKRREEKSPYFLNPGDGNRRDGERVTSAKLRQKPKDRSKDNVIDLLDD